MDRIWIDVQSVKFNSQTPLIDSHGNDAVFIGFIGDIGFIGADR